MLYEIGGAKAPFYGAPRVDARMYGNFWNRVMTLEHDGHRSPDRRHVQEEVFATCEMACKRPPDRNLTEHAIGDVADWARAAADSFTIDVSEATPSGSTSCPPLSPSPPSPPQDPPPTPESPPATSGTVEPDGYVSVTSPGALIVAAVGSSSAATFFHLQVQGDFTRPGVWRLNRDGSLLRFRVLRGHLHEGGATQGERP